LIYFIGKCSQNAGVGVLYIKHFSLLEGTCQDIEVHLIVRTRQWLSQGEGRLRLGGPERCCHQFFLVIRKWVSLQGAHPEWDQPLSGWEARTLTAADHPRHLQGPRLVPQSCLQSTSAQTSNCCPSMLW